jgi:penicillin-binding protein-related factor A (putative recombinase)
MTKLKLKRPEPLEKAIQKTILDYLHRRQIFCWKEHSSGIMVEGGQRYMPLGLKGKADILGIYQGKFLAIEVKRPSGVLSPEQELFLYNIRKHGGIAIVARDVDDLINAGI